MNAKGYLPFVPEQYAPGDSSGGVVRLRKFKSSITLSLLAVAFCAVAPAAAVVGAAADSAAFADRVVMVLTRGPEGSGLCTGVVLAPRIILTAAHCLRGASDMRVLFRDASDQPVTLSVAATLAHPDFHADAAARRTRSLDIGLIETGESLPETFRTATLAVGDPPEPGASVTVAGFGVSREGEWKSGGRLAGAKLRVREPRSRVLLWVEPPSGDSGACSGDSGGPIFDADGKIVVAIVAWTEGRGKAKCGRLTQAVLVAPVADWLGAAMRRFDAGIGAKNGG